MTTKEENLTPTIVTINGGDISGLYSKRNKDIAMYKGIPYAAPPVGDLRWRRPQPVAPWQGVLRCDHPGPASIQPERGRPGVLCAQDCGFDYNKEFYQNGDPYRSEDCLYLNVYTRQPFKGARRPVVVWIHGGAFTKGYSTEPEFEGEQLADKDVVLVTFNFRLGILGFLSHPQLTAENDGKGSGNYGIWDIITVLRWVRDNISKFGGDAGNVTVAGQSAGAATVQMLLTSPYAKGLIHKAVIQSGGGLHGIISTWKQQEAEQRGMEIMSLSGCSSIEQMRQLDARSMPALYDRFLATKDTWNLYAGPNVDGELFPCNTDEAAEKGLTLDIPVMIGTTANDLNPAVMHDAAVNWSLLQERLARHPAYVYRFDYALPGDNSGAFHSSDLWFVFGTLHNCWRPFPKEAWSLSDEMMTLWTHFTATGTPDDNTSWLPYTADNNFVRTFDVR